MTTALLIALAGCGAHSASGAHGDFAGPIEIGNGRHLYLECHGKGGPTVILESGYHNSSDPWSYSDAAAPAVGPAVLPALAGDHRACAYDRPGTLRYPDPPGISDRSSPVPMPRTAHDVVDDLHALADGGEILVSESVRDAVDGRPDIELCPPREVELKGLQGTHNLYAVKVSA